MLRDLARTILKVDWPKFHPRAALRCTPAILLPLVVGILLDHPRQGSMMAAGAFGVGFGSFQELYRSRKAPMLYASLGICVSSWIGTLVGFSRIGSVLLTSAWAFLYGGISALSPGASWVALQCVIWLIISTAYPASGSHALQRGVFMLLGGLLQTLFVVGFWKLERVETPAFGGVGPQEAETSIQGIANSFHPESHSGAYAVRAAVTMAAAASLCWWLQVENGYWIPMTAAIVMKPDFRQTYERGLARIAGTLVGAVVASLIAAHLRHAPGVYATLITLFAFLFHSIVFANYAVYSVCVTSYVVFLLAFSGLQENIVVEHRVINTLLGGVLAFLAHAIFWKFQKTEEPVTTKTVTE
jgi:uncharacterized membrane protein YccC